MLDEDEKLRLLAAAQLQLRNKQLNREARRRLGEMRALQEVADNSAGVLTAVREESDGVITLTLTSPAVKLFEARTAEPLQILRICTDGTATLQRGLHRPPEPLPPGTSKDEVLAIAEAMSKPSRVCGGCSDRTYERYEVRALCVPARRSLCPSLCLLLRCPHGATAAAAHALLPCAGRRVQAILEAGDRAKVF